MQHLEQDWFFALLSHPLYNHIIIELFRLEKTSKIIELQLL